ncbi:unnamed protein product [Caretta caretta]
MQAPWEGELQQFGRRAVPPPCLGSEVRGSSRRSWLAPAGGPSGSKVLPCLHQSPPSSLSLNQLSQIPHGSVPLPALKASLGHTAAARKRKNSVVLMRRSLGSELGWNTMPTAILGSGKL